MVEHYQSTGSEYYIYILSCKNRLIRTYSNFRQLLPATSPSQDSATTSEKRTPLLPVTDLVGLKAHSDFNAGRLSDVTIPLASMLILMLSP